jgi:hypothetical protein
VGIAASAGVSLSGLAAEGLQAPSAGGDNFNRSNGTNLGDSWLERRGDLAILGNQLGVTSTNAVNLALWQLTSLADVRVSAQVNLTPSGGPSAGLVARYTDPFSYYEARLMSSGGAAVAVIYRVSYGVPRVLRWARLTAPQGEVELRFEVTGSTLSLAIDGNELLRVTDRVLSGPGLAGVSLRSGESINEFTLGPPQA